MAYSNWDWRALTSLWEWAKVHKVTSGLTVGGVISACGAAGRMWHWLRNRYDGKVFSLMSEAARNVRLEHPGMNIALMPIKIGDIAEEMKRSEKRVYKSLRRLETAGKVIEVKNGEWCLGNETPKESLNRQWNQSPKGGRLNSGRFGD